MRRTVTTTREYDAEGRVTKETVVEQTFDDPAPTYPTPEDIRVGDPGPQQWRPPFYVGDPVVHPPTYGPMQVWSGRPYNTCGVL